MRIAIASGKGGTGKTTIATSLALSLAGEHNENARVASGLDPLILFLDCDVEAPNAHLFLNPDFHRKVDVSPPIPAIDESLCTYCGRCAQVCEFNAIAVAEEHILLFPGLCHSCGSCVLNCPEHAIGEILRNIGALEAGPASRNIHFARGIMNVGEVMAVPIIRALKKWSIFPDHENGPDRDAKDTLRTVILDAPPGTTCPAVEAVKGSDFVLLVTEPTPFGLHDLRLMAEVISELEIPAGVVINRDGTGYDETERFCEDADLPVMLRIPFDRRIAEGTARRKPLISICPEYEGQLFELYGSIAETVGMVPR